MKCLFCEKRFVPKKLGAWKKRKYCSLECAQKRLIGVKRTNLPSDWYEKWSQNRGGATKGRILTAEHKRKISEAHKGTKKPWTVIRNKQMSGENHPFWKNRSWMEDVKIRQTKKYKDWRLSVLIRDKHKCKRCGKSGKVADHIKPFSLFPELRFEKSNGQCLCNNCHLMKNSEDMKKIREAFEDVK